MRAMWYSHGYFIISCVYSLFVFQIETLQQESRNMNSRVSQLYMQLLHEIINKRDNSLEMRELQNKLLNQTVIYHKLKVIPFVLLTSN